MSQLVKQHSPSTSCTPARSTRKGIHARVVASHAQAQHASTSDRCVAITPTFNRRHALVGIAFTSGWLGVVSPKPAAAKGKEEKVPTVVNDPVALKAQLEAQYQQWAAGQFDAWLAAQPDTIKWQTSYNGVPMKLKGKAGAAQYFGMLKADLDITSYKPLAVFVDNDGDEATVVVEASGTSRRTQQLFKTIFLHMYTIGPMGRVLKFKEVTDTALMAQLVPPPAVPTGPLREEASAAAAAGATALAPGEAPVEPGSAARSV